jgi:hypothetical protein
MLARKINDPLEIVNSLINLAHVKMSIGDYQLALAPIIKRQSNYQLKTGTPIS